MRITVHLVARLFRLPVLRVDGHITLVDEQDHGRSADLLAAQRRLPVGRLLALAEAELAAAENRRPGSLTAVP